MVYLTRLPGKFVLSLLATAKGIHTGLVVKPYPFDFIFSMQLGDIFDQS